MSAIYGIDPGRCPGLAILEAFGLVDRFIRQKLSAIWAIALQRRGGLTSYNWGAFVRLYAVLTGAGEGLLDLYQEPYFVGFLRTRQQFQLPASIKNRRT